MRDDYFTNTEADAGAYERQRAQDDYDPPDINYWEGAAGEWEDPIDQWKAEIATMTHDELIASFPAGPEGEA